VGLITLISHLVAKEGHVFVFSGGAPVCEGCRFRKVCIDRLKKGHVYRVVKVLNIKNRCPLNEYVVTVEVVEEPIKVLLPTSLAIEGMTVKYERRVCSNNSCPYYSLCNPRLLPNTCKVKILKVLRRIKCPKGASLKEVEVVMTD